MYICVSAHMNGTVLQGCGAVFKGLCGGCFALLCKFRAPPLHSSGVGAGLVAEGSGFDS